MRGVKLTSARFMDRRSCGILHGMRVRLKQLANAAADALLSNELVYRGVLRVNERFLWPRVRRWRRVRQSALVHRWLDGLRGVEVGPSELNSFGLQALNVGRRDKLYEREQLLRVGCFSHLHLEAEADAIPLPDGSQDFVFSSHVVEHCPDLIATLREWVRLLRTGGYLFMIVPHRDAAPSDVGRPLTTWEELEELHRRRATHAEFGGVPGHHHYHVFAPATLKSFVARAFGDVLELVDEQERDDQVGNGFALVYRKARQLKSVARGGEVR